jgi:hypothetical protein
MIRLGTFKRLLISVAMIVALIIQSVSLVSGQSLCRMVCSKKKQTCHYCCAGDFSCGVSKSKSDAPRPFVGLQQTINAGSFCQAVLTRTVLLVLPSQTKIRPESVEREFKRFGNTSATNSILLI